MHWRVLAAGADGRTAWRVIEADAPDEARTMAVRLFGAEHLVLRVQRYWAWSEWLPFGQRVSGSAVGTFLRQLGKTLETGMDVLQALDAVGRGAPGPLRRAAASWQRDIAHAGIGLAAAIGAYPLGLPAVVVQILRAGEAAGRLPAALVRAGELTAERARRQAEVRSLLRGPVLTSVLTLAAVIGTSVYAVPLFAQADQAAGQHLPGVTESMVVVTDALRAAWLPLLTAVVAAAAVYFVLAQRSRAFRVLIARISLRLPVLGPVLHEAATVEFLETLHGLVDAALPLSEMVPLLVVAAGNPWWEAVLRAREPHLLSGEPLGIGIAASGLLPPVASMSLRAAGETGVLAPDSLSVLADYYRDSLLGRIERAKEVIPIVMYVLLGGVIMWFAVATTLPQIQMLPAAGGL